MRHYLSLFLIALAMLGGLTLQGCNTMEGMGEDVESAGEAMEEEAEEADD